MDFAFSFIIRNGGLDTEKDYKNKAADGVCNVNEDVPPNDENALKKVGILSMQCKEALDRLSFMHVGDLSCARCCWTSDGFPFEQLGYIGLLDVHGATLDHSLYLPLKIGHGRPCIRMYT